MRARQPKYKFYPSILDKYTNFLGTDAENFWYQDEEGGWHKNYSESTGYRYSQTEVYELSKAELINAINRVPTVSEAANKGTAFNELIDALITKKRSNILKTRKVYLNVNGEYLYSELPLNNEVFKLVGVEAEIKDSKFIFDIGLLKSAADYFNGSLNQVYTSAIIETDYGAVELYGYIDELNRNKVYDIKTTKKYEFGKYSKYWQRHVYPYCLLESKTCTDIESFEFTCFQLYGGTERNPIITGDKYPELYNYDHEQSKAALKSHCERFIEFLEENRSLITDKKIFGGENIINHLN